MELFIYRVIRINADNTRHFLGHIIAHYSMRQLEAERRWGKATYRFEPAL